ncbi:uncharacterized protein LOC117289274 isoform X2 [Asterias rubens]|uniref:uncharacterized protein LOC117289274 isoform X2 n=1 Tax=Asterias rubens TaxID=7604 RepID=UPI001455B0FC|nr:uncharacterized protein LOC117289274 isoform X2 [Asterias rubens]
MGKANKQRSKLVKMRGTSEKQPTSSSQKVFKVSQHKATKAKNKAKVVSTSLKRLNFQNRQNVSKNDEKFTDVQISLTTSNKSQSAKKPVVQKMSHSSSSIQQPNMDEATKQMALL